MQALELLSRTSSSQFQQPAAQKGAKGGTGSITDMYRVFNDDVSIRWVILMTLGTQKVQQKITLHESYPSSIMKQVCGSDARWRIDHLVNWKDRWVLTTTRLEREKISQYVILKPEFPTNELSDGWLKGYHCGVLEYGKGFWYLVMQKSKTPLKQSSFMCNSFPDHPIPNLSHAVFGGTQWVILMTDGVPPQTFLRWEHFDRIFLKEQLFKGKNVSFLGHGNGMWHLGLADRPDRQTVMHTSVLPLSEITEYHSQGYRITHMAYRGNRRHLRTHMSGPEREGPLAPVLLNKWQYPVSVTGTTSFIVSPVTSWTTLICDTKVRRGCWYYEVRVLVPEIFQVGWVRDGFEPDEDGGVGDDELSWAFDGVRTKKWHGEGKDYGTTTRLNDLVGCLIDCDRRAVSFLLNGTSLGVAYHHIAMGDGLYPAISLSKGASVSVNFGAATTSGLLPPTARPLRITEHDMLALPAREGADSPKIINPWNCECHLLSDGLEVLHTAPWGSLRASVGVRRGKWYYEIKLLTTGVYQIGWALGGFVPQTDKDLGVGDDNYSWSYDGSRRCVWHAKNMDYGSEPWKEGDIVGCAIDLDALTMTFYLNGKSLGVAFQRLETFGAEVHPAWSLGAKHKCLLNFGATPLQSLPPGYQALFVDVSTLPPQDGRADAPALENCWGADVHTATDGQEVVNLSGFSTVAANVRVRRSKWMYEVTLGSEDLLQIGWGASAFRPSVFGHGVGDDHASWAYDGNRLLKWHAGREVKYGSRWRVGDVVGCAVDCDAGDITFYLNGESLGIAFTNVAFDRCYGLRPALTLSEKQRCKINFGRTPFKYPVAQFAPIFTPKERTGSSSSSGGLGGSVSQLGLDDSQRNIAPSMSPPPSRLVDSGNSSKWEILMAELKVGERLGEGNFGEVYAGVWRRTTRVAVKKLKKEKTGSSDMAQEAGMLLNLPPHLNIVQFYGVCTMADAHLAIVTELLENGSLIRFLHTSGKGLSRKQLLGIAMQIAAGMHHLHSNSVIHRDLAARNILVGGQSYGNWVVKVADFGLSRFGDAYTLRSSAIPVKWSAPEAISKRLFTRASDVWSFGIVMFELFTLGDVPYAFFDEETTYKRVKTGYRLDKPDDCPDDAYAVMKSCWFESPDARPTFSELFDSLEKIDEASAMTPAAARGIAVAQSDPQQGEYVVYGSAN